MRASQALPSGRRIWPLLVPAVLVVALAILWTGLWFYAAAAAEGTIAGWLDREAKAGRVYACADRSIAGFPFRITVHCAEPNWELRGIDPPLALRFSALNAVWQVYEPTLVVSDFNGPMAISEPGMPPGYVANWQRGTSSVRGTPRAPERVSIELDEARVERANSDSDAPLMEAKRMELTGRIAAGSPADNPVIEIVLQLAAASAPEGHPLLAKPFDGDFAVMLKGLPNLEPKPLRQRIHELQALGGSIEITKARVQSGDVIAVTSGTLKLTERGALDGQLQLTVVNLEQVLRALNLEAMMTQGKVGSTINALDRLLPGLGNIARQNAAPSVMAGLGAFGQRTVLEDKPAVSVPLRFADGAVMLGPFKVADVPPLL